jgi:hypothetical protein
MLLSFCKEVRYSVCIINSSLTIADMLTSLQNVRYVQCTYHAFAKVLWWSKISDIHLHATSTIRQLYHNTDCCKPLVHHKYSRICATSALLFWMRTRERKILERSVEVYNCVYVTLLQKFSTVLLPVLISTIIALYSSLSILSHCGDCYGSQWVVAALYISLHCTTLTLSV